MISDLFLAYLLRIWHTYVLNVFSTWIITLTELALHHANSVIVIFYVEKAVKAYVCQMCEKYAKTKSGIMTNYQKEHILFFILNHWFWDFKTMLQKANPTLIDSFLDNQKRLIGNVTAQPLQ